MAYKQQDRELLLMLMKLQENTAPITLSIGYTDSANQVKAGILIQEAPPKVIETLVAEGYICSLTAGGLFVYKL